MKTKLSILIIGMFFVGSSVAGISNTKHNLGSTGTGNNSTANIGEICVFCHTPHGGDNSAPVPLWNKVLTSSTFETYDQLGTSTLDGAISDVGGVSLACLTCHDGTQAIDNIINAPGSGGLDSSGGGTNGLDWAWNTGGTVDTDGIFDIDAAANIGTDLTNDHPISVQYGGGGISSNSSGPLRDGDFVLPLRIGITNRWYIDNTTMAGSLGSVAGSFDKWDFQLYTKTLSGTDSNGVAFAGVPEPFVECGSCHDPHAETTTFLRIDPSANPAGDQSNAGSKVCLTCHNK